MKQRHRRDRRLAPAGDPALIPNRDDRARLDRLRAAVIAGFDEAERGETVPYTPDLMDRLKQEATEAALAGVPIPDEVKP
jgi:hypothetical protein